MSKGDECTMDMVLQSMADSLMNVEHLFVVPYHEEVEPNCKVGGKPPREVFYRNTLTFATKIPLAVSARRCTSQYVSLYLNSYCYSISYYNQYNRYVMVLKLLSSV